MPGHVPVFFSHLLFLCNILLEIFMVGWYVERGMPLKTLVYFCFWSESEWGKSLCLYFLFYFWLYVKYFQRTLEITFCLLFWPFSPPEALFVSIPVVKLKLVTFYLNPLNLVSLCFVPALELLSLSFSLHFFCYPPFGSLDLERGT